MTHNFQPNSKKDNSYKTPYCAEYNTKSENNYGTNSHYNKREPKVSNNPYTHIFKKLFRFYTAYFIFYNLYFKIKIKQ